MKNIIIDIIKICILQGNMEEENGESLHLCPFLAGQIMITCKSIQVNFILIYVSISRIKMNYDETDTEIRNYYIALETVSQITEGQTNIPWDLVP